MPLSNDNQDFGLSDEKNDNQNNLPNPKEVELTSDDLKGKKVDADVELAKEKPADQK